MKFIEKVLKGSYKKKYKNYITLIFSFLFIILCGVLAFLKVEGLPVLIVCLLNFFLYIVCQIYYRKKYKDFNNTKMYKELVKKGYLTEFINTINAETKDENAIKYYDEIYEVGLVMTKTWFIYISCNKPIVEKITEINRMGAGTITNPTPSLAVEFKDKSFQIAYNIDYFEIEAKIKEKYLDISIDYNMFDDE